MGVLIAIVAIVILSRLLSWPLARVGQPPVIGEVLAGILLGPSLIGPERSAFIVAPSAMPALAVVANIGVVLYMFLVGLELDFGLARHRARVAALVASASTIVPFALGVAVALIFQARLHSPQVPLPTFALFMGVAMSITAFPVLARILTDSRMTSTDVGVIALSAAAMVDVVAWCLLAVVTGVAHLRLGQELFVVAFVLGASVPHDSRIARMLTGSFRWGVSALLLPAFFALTGVRTRIDLLSGAEQWLVCAGLILVATAGKFGGTFAAARFAGLGSRRAAALGALMNTRGLMELIVLNVGLELGVISPTLFAMMVVMALVTTASTSPVLRYLGSGDPGGPLTLSPR